jgi:hypothetical protein
MVGRAQRRHGNDLALQVADCPDALLPEQLEASEASTSE